MSGIMQLLLSGRPQVASDPYFEYTTLLLPGNGTNGAQNNTFLDSSTNAFTITRNGNTTQGTFSPFSQTGWGNYFDGSGDYLTAPSDAAFAVGSAFTIEAWVYPNATPSGEMIITCFGTSNGFQVGWQSGTLFGLAASGVAWRLTGSTVPTPNAWNHVVVVRSGTGTNQTSVYINGTRTANGTVTDAFTSTSSCFVGRDFSGAGQYAGYISNLRIVKGTAVYDPSQSTLTVPTTPLTAITNTSLLTCQSNRFIDNSTNNFTITRNGDVSVQAFSPFNPTAAWSAATNGGSGYFDGSGDYLTTNATQAIPATGDFTIEAWVYPTVSGAGRCIVSQGTAGASGRTQLSVHTNNTLQLGITTTIVYSTGTVTPNAWNYVAVTRTGSSVTFYINGANAGTATASGTIQNTTLEIGGEWNGDPYRWLGYLTSVRISNTLRTISSSPTAPLTSDGNTAFLCNFTNAGIFDATAKNDLETVGNAQISTTQSKFGGSSMYFDGTGDWLTAPNNADLQLATNNFTIEMWVYLATGDIGSNRGLAAKGGASTGWLISLNTTEKVVFTYASSTITSSGSISTNQWVHIAVVREGTGSNQTKIYINGTNDGTGTVNTNFNQTEIMYVGANRTGGDPMKGYIQDLRITKGVARYTSNFTPPTSAFPLFGV